jgi:outer membrane biosynthesis protein TonB
VLELLAESIDPESPERVALDLFDRLRLREPFARAFTALGFEDEEGWRVAARIKVVLLTGSGIGKPENSATETTPAAEPETPKVSAETVVDAEEEQGPETSADAAEESSSIPSAAPAAVDERIALSPDLWHDPDVRWLTGVHEADAHSYLVREQYEELLWWLLMPSLLLLAGEAAPSRAAVEEMSKTVSEALATAEAAGYRIDTLLGEAKPQFTDEAQEPEVESQQTEPEVVEPHQSEPDKPEIDEPVTEEPEIENPEPEQAEAKKPEAKKPEAKKPEAEKPQPQDPDNETPPAPDPDRPV